MNWYKSHIIAEAKIAEYPYYLAIYSEGRFKGLYPPQIALVPDMKRMWDRGELGAGKKTTELKDNTIRGLLDQVRSHNKHPAYDNVDFYIVRARNSPRERIQYSRLLDMMREEA